MFRAHRIFLHGIEHRGSLPAGIYGQGNGKDLMKLDEQLNIFHQLINHQMLNLFPKEDDPNHKWYAPGDDLSAFTGKDSMFVSRIFDMVL